MSTNLISYYRGDRQYRHDDSISLSCLINKGRVIIAWIILIVSKQ